MLGADNVGECSVLDVLMQLQAILHKKLHCVRRARRRVVERGGRWVIEVSRSGQGAGWRLLFGKALTLTSDTMAAAGSLALESTAPEARQCAHGIVHIAGLANQRDSVFYGRAKWLRKPILCRDRNSLKANSPGQRHLGPQQQTTVVTGFLTIAQEPAPFIDHGFPARLASHGGSRSVTGPN